MAARTHDVDEGAARVPLRGTQAHTDTTAVISMKMRCQVCVMPESCILAAWP